MPPVGQIMTLVRWTGTRFFDCMCTVRADDFAGGKETPIMARWARRADLPACLTILQDGKTDAPGQEAYPFGDSGAIAIIRKPWPPDPGSRDLGANASATDIPKHINCRCAPLTPTNELGGAKVPPRPALPIRKPGKRP